MTAAPRPEDEPTLEEVADYFGVPVELLQAVAREDEEIEPALCCEVCGGDLALATGVCVDCGHDQLGYYDDEDFSGWMHDHEDGGRRPWPAAVDLGATGREALG